MATKIQSSSVVVCGGLKVGAKAAHVLNLDLWGRRGKANVFLDIEDIHVPLQRDVPAALQDLVEIAAYIYSADQCVLRGKIDVDTFGARWRRSFHYHVPVRCPELWNSRAVSSVLKETLEFLSDDFYEFTFYATDSGEWGAAAAAFVARRTLCERRRKQIAASRRALRRGGRGVRTAGCLATGRGCGRRERV